MTAGMTCIGVAGNSELKEDKDAFSVVSGAYDKSPENDAGEYKTDRSDH